MIEHDITPFEAEDILSGHGGYGTVRIYGVMPGTVENPNPQIVGIKSTYHLRRFKYTRIYAVTNDGQYPIRKAGEDY